MRKHMVQDGGGCCPRLHVCNRVIRVAVEVGESVHHTHLLTEPGDFPGGVSGLQHHLHCFNIFGGVVIVRCREDGHSAVDGGHIVAHCQNWG